MKFNDRSKVADCTVLYGVVLLSVLPYLFGLGFYADDWWYQATLAHFSGQGIVTMARELYKADRGMLLRPVQIAYLVLGFEAFGRHATLYHIVNSVVLGMVTVLLYIVLRTMRVGRWLAFVIALIFGLLPHYSTDRFWISSHQANLSMAFALFGIYSLLRSFQSTENYSKKWIALAVLGLVLSFFSYEVTLGLIISAIVIIGVSQYIKVPTTTQSKIKDLSGIAITAVALLLVGIVKVRLQRRLIYQHDFLLLFWKNGWRAVTQAVRFNLWTYGLHMPSVLISLSRHSALSGMAIASATIIAVFVTSYLWRCLEPSAIPSRSACSWLIALGFVLFGLGYMLFFADPGIDFSAQGLDNRVAIASAVGASSVLAATMGLACSLLKSQVVRARAFSMAIGVICGMNCLVVSGMSFFWVNAASRQSEILKDVASGVRLLPQGSVLLLDGFCRYSGPGAIFYMNWDATGAIQLTLGDYSLTSNVVRPSLPFLDSAVGTTISGQFGQRYSYGNHLFVYNVRRKILISLASKETADAYLHTEASVGDGGCQPIQDENGVKIF